MEKLRFRELERFLKVMQLGGAKARLGTGLFLQSLFSASTLGKGEGTESLVTLLFPYSGVKSLSPEP